MPKIFINNICNLQCSYCFAKNVTNLQDQKEISLEQLNNILQWMKKINYKEPIAVLGGEPTLHSKFEIILNNIIKFSEDNNILPPSVFSNGIFLQDYILLFKNAFLLLNINEPLILKNNFNLIINNIKQFYDLQLINNHVNIGINLYPNINNFSYIFDIANEYNFNMIRCSYVSPVEINNDLDKFEYYKKGKITFLNFIEMAYQNKKKIGIDCNYIPLCFFNTDELELLQQVCSNPIRLQRFVCFPPALDIMPDLTGVTCMGVKKQVNLTQFNSYKEIQEYFYKQFLLLINKNDNKCLQCNYFKQYKCQGGCLSFNV